ncbi:PrgI family protein [Streptomyces sp. NPDC059009]|uniref:PrgI family protein n=1 Tax=Streptomyces sp. NPDC059009 TaxID=3346694 RepID=UPI0036B22E10
MTQPVRIPADVEREDVVLAHLNARQLLILAVTGMLLYGAWMALRDFVPVLVFLLFSLPLAGTAALLALGSRDGLSLDRLALAAVRQRLAPRYHVAAPEGIVPPPLWLARRARGRTGDSVPSALAMAPVQLPAEHVSETGVVDLGADGVAAIAVCGTVNFALRTPAEQESLVSGFGRYLHSLTAPVEVLVRTERLDLSMQISELRAYAAELPDPALETAAREHADYLEQLTRESDLLQRQVLLVLREPLGGATGSTAVLDEMSPLTGLGRRRRNHADLPPAHALRRAAEVRLARRLDEASELLGPLGITVTPLDAGQATAILVAACNPDSLVPPSAARAKADEVITSDSSPGRDCAAQTGTGRGESR